MIIQNPMKGTYLPTKAKEIGLKVTMIEENQELQDAILSIHHTTMLSLDAARISKIIENQEGKSMIGIYDLPKKI